MVATNAHMDYGAVMAHSSLFHCFAADGIN